MTVDGEQLVNYALFNRGILFDAVTTSYLLTIPWLIGVTAFILNRFNMQVARVMGTVVVFLAIPALIISAADFAWFRHYGTRVSKSVFAWMDDGESALDVLWDDPLYLTLIVLFVLFFFLVRWSVRWIRNYTVAIEQRSYPLIFRMIVFLISGGILFYGVRGDFESHAKPLQTVDAFRTPHPFVNQLGLNPVFNFIHSIPGYQMELMDEEEAIARSREYLGIEQYSENPFRRELSSSAESASPKNLILILMESMSTEKVGWYHEDRKSVTPNLDSLIGRSLFFPNTYSCGIHTYNGIYSTLYSLPALIDKKPTTDPATSSLKHGGLPVSLKKRGYQTHYFCTGSPRFDNIWGFLPENGMDKIHHGLNIPDGIWYNGWGMGDHSMFELGLNSLDSIHASGDPFFATFMTISTHSPWDIPEGIDFVPDASTPLDKSYQYADWAIGQFMQGASKKEWFEESIFVFVADHGQKFNVKYEMPLGYHHTPLLFYSPKYIDAEVDNSLASQLDVFPTAMGLLGGNYVNQGLGVDLCRESRPYVFFSADDKWAVLGKEYYYFSNLDGRSQLYHYALREKENLADKESSIAAEMSVYGRSMFQSANAIVRNRWQSAE